MIFFTLFMTLFAIEDDISGYKWDDKVTTIEEQDNNPEEYLRQMEIAAEKQKSKEQAIRAQSCAGYKWGREECFPDFIAQKQKKDACEEQNPATLYVCRLGWSAKAVSNIKLGESQKASTYKINLHDMYKSHGQQ